MSLLRTFIAIELPDAIQHAIEKETAALRESIDSGCVRWTPVDNVHVTLKFLGDSSAPNIELLKQMLDREAAAVPPFEVTLQNLGSFPNQRRPRIIWIGLEAPAALASLQRAVEAGAARLGYEAEGRPFSPHLTIGRVRQNLQPAQLQTIGMRLKENQIGRIGSSRVDSVELFKSDLQPQGSVYTILHSASFLGTA